MWNITKLRTAPLVLMLLTGSIFGQSDERAEVLALMERAFAAVGSGSAEEWRAIQLADGTSLSFRPRAGGTSPGELEMRMSTNEALLADDTEGVHTQMERWTGEPTVMIRGPIAVVWGEYEYWLDGKFSHCGVDSIDLVKPDGQWKIANWMWTVEKDNCPNKPQAENGVSR